MSQTQTMLTASTNVTEEFTRPPHLSIALRCPVCKQELQTSHPDDQQRCSKCGFEFLYIGGILRGLPQEREFHFSPFIREYEMVRAKEGRGSSSDEYYLALPFSDLTGNNCWQWTVRASTYRYLINKVLAEIEKASPAGCDVLDIGAGNCWLSYRLASRGHRPVAVDLLDNSADGLGAGRRYFPHIKRPFVRVQAEMDNLPFASGQFDIAIFNASLHYSANYQQTLREAARCLRRPGYLIVADSPFYNSERDGQEMLAEKRSTFAKKFNISPDDMQACEYLTPEVLSRLEDELGLAWSAHKPWYGIRWLLRPAKAFFLRKRKPSKFYLFAASI
ncbi:MAG: Methyltransferase type 11 [Acidobacteriaceae bacterium]|jgi:SAM-dependent methyltransferase|nr:Methyltransferase type 11 [Acidobacteriaceae bacterium]